MAEIAFSSILELSNLISLRKISPLEIVSELLARIERHDPRLNYYITVCRDSAIESASRANDSDGYKGLLHGIPIAHKDLFYTKGIETTGHSRVLQGFYPDHDATIVSRLAEAGMIMIGKTNTAEFGCGGLELYGVSRNPWDLSRYTGGSSCGSVGSVAAGLAIAATGSDTGGSIRCPASFCGVVGLRPTFGRASCFGLLRMSWSMDTPGPITRTVSDAAILLQHMAGHDPADPSTAERPVADYLGLLTQGIRGVTIGVPEEHFYEQVDSEVLSSVRAALKVLELLGARVQPVCLPVAKDFHLVTKVLSLMEAFGQHAPRLRQSASQYAASTRRRVMSGAFYTSAEYEQVCQIRALWISELRQAMSEVDALVTPTVPFTALTREEHERPREAADVGRNSYPFSLAGLPSLSVPCGFSSTGLPIGMQVIAKPFDEQLALRIGHAFEQATEWHKRRPPSL